VKGHLLKRESELDTLADEIVELVDNSKKLTDILKVTQENEIIQKKNLSEIATLKNRITNLENRLNELIKSFRIDIVEAERLITEKYEDINKERNQSN
jgi:DNA repair exonuclease SbcCD ATPase subunit